MTREVEGIDVQYIGKRHKGGKLSSVLYYVTKYKDNNIKDTGIIFAPMEPKKEYSRFEIIENKDLIFIFDKSNKLTNLVFREVVENGTETNTEG